MFNPLFSFVRKFSHRHLAQIKYIVPEAVQIDKLLVHDEKTMCMKPDVKITLHLDAVEDHKEHSMFMTLSNLFASRLVDFLHKHAQVIILKVWYLTASEEFFKLVFIQVELDIQNLMLQ